MKLKSLNDEKIRPVSLRRKAVFQVGTIGLIILILNQIIWNSPLIQVVPVLTRLAIRHIPPILWVGSLLIVGLWLLVMVQAWRE